MVGDHCINCDTPVEVKVHLAHQITHTIPFVKSAIHNIDDL